MIVMIKLMFLSRIREVIIYFYCTRVIQMHMLSRHLIQVIFLSHSGNCKKGNSKEKIMSTSHGREKFLLRVRVISFSFFFFLFSFLFRR